MKLNPGVLKCNPSPLTSLPKRLAMLSYVIPTLKQNIQIKHIINQQKTSFSKCLLSYEFNFLAEINNRITNKNKNAAIPIATKVTKPLAILNLLHIKKSQIF